MNKSNLTYFNNKKAEMSVLRHTLIPKFRRLRQEDYHELAVSLG